MKVLRVKITCEKCGQTGFIDFGFWGTLRILWLIAFGQVATAEKSI